MNLLEKVRSNSPKTSLEVFLHKYSKNNNSMEENTNDVMIIETDLLNELSELVEHSQQQIIVQNNSILTLLFW